MRTLLLVLLLGCVASPAAFDYKFDVDMSPYQHTSNLLKDSSKTGDVNGSLNGRLNFYPVNGLETHGFAQYQLYDKTSSLSNWQYGGGLTYIPTSDSSRFNIYLSGTYRKYSYKDELTVNSSEFLTESADITVGSGYQLSPTAYSRLGFMYTSIGYAEERVATVKDKQLFGGINLTLFNRMAIDFEGGYTFGNFQGTDSATGAIPDPEKAYNSLTDLDLNSYYFSGRLSHQLGKAFGIAYTVSYKEFTDRNEQYVIYGYSSGYLSPWVNTYEGTSFELQLTTYALPRFIVKTGFGYFDKDMLSVVESTLSPGFFPVYLPTTLRSQDRLDSARKLYLSLTYPLTNQTGVLLKPEFRIDYTNNNSSIDVYNYDDLTIQFSLTAAY